MTWGSSLFGGDSSKVAQHLTEGVVQVCGTNTACAALLIDGSVLALFSYTSMLLLQFIHTSVLYLFMLMLVFFVFSFFVQFYHSFWGQPVIFCLLLFFCAVGKVS